MAVFHHALIGAACLLLSGLLLSSVALASEEGCPEGVLYSPPSENERVRVVAIHPRDPEFEGRSGLVGLEGRVVEVAHAGGEPGCWMRVKLGRDDGPPVDLAVAAVRSASAASDVRTGSVQVRRVEGLDRHQGKSIKGGQRFIILGVHRDDPHLGRRESLVGEVCHAQERMRSTSKGWFSGRAACGDSGVLTFYGVAAHRMNHPKVAARKRDGSFWRTVGQLVEGAAATAAAVSDKGATARVAPFDIMVRVINAHDLAVQRYGLLTATLSSGLGYTEPKAYELISEQASSTFRSRGIDAIVDHSEYQIRRAAGKVWTGTGFVEGSLQTGTYRLLRIRVNDPAAVARAEKGDLMVGVAVTAGKDLSAMVREQVEVEVARSLHAEGVRFVMLP